MSERKEVFIKPMVSNVKNVLTGYQMARERSGRELIDRGITSYFILVVGVLLREEIQPETISNVMRLEDVIERQNFFGDEFNKSSEHSPFWEEDHFAEEYAGLITDVNGYLVRKYGREEGSERTIIIQNTLEKWFDVNEAVENYVAGRFDVDNAKEEEIEIVQPLIDCEEDQKPIVYRNIVDSAWLDTLLITATDGDAQKVKINKLKDPVLSMTLALQACDDYAGQRRNERIGKMTLMSHTPNTTSSKRVNETIHFMNCLDGYLAQSDMGPYMASLVKYAMVSRGMICRLKARKTGDYMGRDEVFYKEFDQFERNLNQAISPHMYDLSDSFGNGK